MRRRHFAFGALAALGFLQARAADWPMLGGSPSRLMVSAEKGLPVTWDGAAPTLKWAAPLGRTTFGSPVVADGRVYIGTDNDTDDPVARRAVLLCLAEADGRVLWTATHEKLRDPAADDASLGICSTPAVADGRVVYMSNRAELVCRAAADGKELWSIDLRATLGVAPNQASASSPLIANGLVFVVTGHGADYKSGKVKNAAAPSFLAVDLATGKIAWQDASPGDRILTGQWGSPGYSTAGGTAQAIFPGGDGWLYSFEARTGKLLWKFDGKAHEKRLPTGEPETVFQFLAAPVCVGDRVYAAIGEPEAGSAPGALRCIDATKRGDVTATAEVWRLADDAFGDSISMPVLHDGILYAADAPGFLHAVDAATGARVWSHDLKSNIWGSPLVADGKVYVQSSDGAVAVLATGREKKLLAFNTTLPDLAHGTPVAANGVLYITGQKQLFALKAP